MQEREEFLQQAFENELILNPTQSNDVFQDKMDKLKEMFGLLDDAEKEVLKKSEDAKEADAPTENSKLCLEDEPEKEADKIPDDEDEHCRNLQEQIVRMDEVRKRAEECLQRVNGKIEMMEDKINESRMKQKMSENEMGVEYKFKKNQSTQTNNKSNQKQVRNCYVFL